MIIGESTDRQGMMPDARYAWLVVAYTLLLQAVTLGVLIYSFALFAVPFIDEFDAPRGQVMLAIALLQIGMGVVSPLAGRAMDAVPMRHLVSAGALLMAAGLWMVAHAGSLWLVVLVYALVFPFALALSGTLAAQTLVTRWFSARRGLAIGVSATGTNLGGVVFPLLVGGWISVLGWRDTLEWLALLALGLLLPATWLVLRRNPPLAETASNAVASVQTRVWTTREILSSPMLWIPVIAMLPLNLAFGAVQFNLGAYSQDLGLAPERAGQLIALGSGFMIAGKFFFGGLGDRLDHRMLFWLAAGCMSAALVILASEPSVWLLVVGVALVGLAGGGILPMLGLIFAARFGVASFGRVMGIVMLALATAALGPLLAGSVYDLTGSYRWAFITFLVLFVPASVLMRRLPAAHMD